MADPLYYSCWLRSFSALQLLNHFERVLKLVPFSPENPGPSVLRVQAVSASEAPLLEQAFVDPVDFPAVAAAAREFLSDDCAYTFEGWWGLWTFQKDWELKPARIAIQCFGPRFEDAPHGESGSDPEHFRIDFGLDTWFLPQAELPGAAWYARSNLKGLLKLVHSIEEVLPVERKVLWTESGENFAERLAAAAREL